MNNFYMGQRVRVVNYPTAELNGSYGTVSDIISGYIKVRMDNPADTMLLFAPGELRGE